MQTNIIQEVALTNSRTLKKLCKARAETEPGSVAFYDIRPGNREGLLLAYPEPARGQHTNPQCFYRLDALPSISQQCQITESRRHTIFT